MLAVACLCLGVSLVLVAAALWGLVRWGEGRRTAILVSDLATQQRIDATTRQTIADMRRAALETKPGWPA